VSAPYLTRSRVERLGRQLSGRDQAVLETLAVVRVATSRQLERLHFAGVSRRQARSLLASLVARRLLARLPRVVGGVRSGSAGYVYLLDVAGQRLMRPSTGRVVRPWPVGTPFLTHSLAVTELLVGLTEAAHSSRSEVRLLDFRTEPACWRSFTGRGGERVVLKPDAEAVLEVGVYRDSWFLEVDRATESRPTLDRKLARYVDYWQTGREQTTTGVFPRVLWIVPDLARHAVLIDAFARTPVEAWPLFAVATDADAISRILGGAAS
jgi:hypothetical protein